MAEHLLLKWGNLKGWDVTGNEAATEALKAYLESGQSAGGYSAMAWLDDTEKQALCNLIDATNGEIQNDWSGEIMTKDEAKKYVLEYGQ